MTYAEAIKKLRRKMILTQTEFAALLKVSFGAVNRWESGKYRPTTKTKRKQPAMIFIFLVFAFRNR